MEPRRVTPDSFNLALHAGSVKPGTDERKEHMARQRRFLFTDKGNITNVSWDSDDGKWIQFTTDAGEGVALCFDNVFVPEDRDDTIKALRSLRREVDAFVEATIADIEAMGE